MMTNCRNCQTPLAGEYCANCGQRNLDLERPIWSLVGDVLKETFEVDGRTWLTLRTLFRYPGKLTSDFLDGRRVTAAALPRNEHRVLHLGRLAGADRATAGSGSGPRLRRRRAVALSVR